MRILITGARGMLGRTLVKELSGHEICTCDRSDADIADEVALDKIFSEAQPKVVIHCAAMTAVDRCESEIDTAYRTNVIGTTNVARLAYKYGSKLIAISTDYVFDGDLDRPYHEFDKATGGSNVYGQSKWAAEEAVRAHCPNHIIARVSWLYGAGGPSFVHTMLRLADGTRPQLKVVDDQIGNPTSTLAVARAIKEILKRIDIVGTVHLTCEGETSWYGFARKIFELANVEQKVVPCTSAEYPTPAKRPKNSRLEKRVLRLRGLPPMPQWEDALAEFIAGEFPQNK
jgi:dTDP-4-dehydrorhamnose reductase